MTSVLYRAIMAMDSYNRGYAPGLQFSSDTPGIHIGNAEIIDSRGQPVPMGQGFYALAYQVNGETIIAYRGTDYLLGDSAQGIGSDFNNGYGLSSGLPEFSPQGNIAIQFYKDVVSGVYGTGTALNTPDLVTLTGHSLGGGLAGYVGALYGQKASLFDNMAFEASADLAHTSAAFGGSFLNLIYNGGPTWNVNIANMRTYFVDGEFLAANRFIQTTPKTPLFLGPDVDLIPLGDGQLGIAGDFLGAHSMALLNILLYNHITAGSINDWHPAAQYFWPQLYDNSFADRAGVNENALLGRDITNHDFAAALRQILAYSMIDDGDNDTQARPFGDTGIRAFWDDANQLGQALSTSGVSQNLPIY